MNTRFLYCFIWIFLDSICASESSSNISCDFETGLCGWSSSSQSNFDWILGSGPTPDRTSGPNVDHTSGTKSGKYLYIRSRDARLSKWTAIITHNATLNTAALLEFWYYMNGNGIGKLSVTQSLDDGRKVTLWTRNGRQGQQWIQANVKLPSGSCTLHFEASAAYHYGGDLAIDDIMLIEKYTTSTKPTSQESTTRQASVSLPFVCDFEGSLCGIKSPISLISSLTWKIRSGGISYGGKDLIKGDDNTGNGNYFVIESPISGQNGDSADLELPWMQTLLTTCLTLSYIMPSKRSGTISVYKKYSDLHKDLLFEISGYQGEEWKLMYLTIKPSKTFQIVIQGSHTGVPYSVLGIDDIHVNTGSCKEYTTKPPESTVPTLPHITISRHYCSGETKESIPELTCGFSDSLCDFNATKGFLSPSWYRTNTSKYFQSSKNIDDNFIYANMDSWYVVPNRTASLTSQFVQGSNLCLIFEYYLNHKSSNLILLIENSKGLQEVIWSANFTEKRWKMESININYGGRMKLLFKSRKESPKGLVGLDNIKGYISHDVTSAITTSEVLRTTPSSPFEYIAGNSTENAFLTSEFPLPTSVNSKQNNPIRSTMVYPETTTETERTKLSQQTTSDIRQSSTFTLTSEFLLESSTSTTPVQTVTKLTKSSTPTTSVQKVTDLTKSSTSTTPVQTVTKLTKSSIPTTSVQKVTDLIKSSTSTTSVQTVTKLTKSSTPTTSVQKVTDLIKSSTSTTPVQEVTKLTKSSTPTTSVQKVTDLTESSTPTTSVQKVTEMERKKSETDSSYTTGVVIGVLVPTICLSAILGILIIYNKKWKSKKITGYSETSKAKVLDVRDGYEEQNAHVNIEMVNHDFDSYRKLPG